MTQPSPILRSRFRFLQPSSGDLERLFPASERILPQPHPIYPTDESTAPISGFPVLVNPLLEELRKAVQLYIEAEEAAQIARHLRQPADRARVEQAWRHYADLLGQISRNAIAASFGRQVLPIFWLFHSIAVGRAFKESPRRCSSQSPELTPAQTAAIKYRVFRRYVDGVVSVTRKQAEAVGQRIGPPEDELFPALLTRMKDNVLILSEDHVGADLKELEPFFNGFSGVDGRAFRNRLRLLKDWHRERFANSRSLRQVALHLLSVDASEDPDRLLTHPGWVSYLATLDGFDSAGLFSPSELELWNETLERLKEFEILLAWRRLVTPVQQEQDRLSFAGGGQLAESARALDFSTPSVIDPIVRRFGLVYDMARFAEIVSVLRLTGRDTEDDSFRAIFEFQKWTNRLAWERRVTLEKYLGDGALYSARAAEPLLAVAIRLQRRYTALVDSGFPLDRGMRMALNFGAYRLIPLDSGGREPSQRFEFLGHGINELSRLVTGKATRQIDEMRDFLIGRGFASTEVDAFFYPLVHREAGEPAARDRDDPYPAHIDRNGTLVNDGIVATDEFLLRLQPPSSMWRIAVAGRSWTAIELDDRGERLLVGIRKLGRPQFKGMGNLEVFAVCDGARFADQDRVELEPAQLLSSLRSEYRERAAKSK